MCMHIHSAYASSIYLCMHVHGLIHLGGGGGGRGEDWGEQEEVKFPTISLQKASICSRCMLLITIMLENAYACTVEEFKCGASYTRN